MIPSPSAPTKGPWRVSKSPPTKTRGIDILAGAARMVANVPMHPDFMPEERETDKANATLIAAAPDMLAAADVIFGSLVMAGALVKDGYIVSYEAMAGLRAAAAKARGNTP